MAEPIVTDQPEAQRLELTVDGELAGWLDYRPAGTSTIIAHTEVRDGHEGAGLGGVLVREAIRRADAGGKTVIATCPFAAAYVARHPELERFVRPARRPERGGAG